MSKFLQGDDDNIEDAKAIVIPRVFSPNSRAKNAELGIKRARPELCPNRNL